MRPALALAAAAVVVACGGPDGDEFLVRDSAGVRIATSRAPAWGQEPEWRLTEPSLAIRAGGAVGAVTGVTDAHRFPDGRILVADNGAAELRFHDARGELIRTVGGAGSGPGEYRSLDGVAVIDDSLWVYDRTLGRVSVLDADGRYIRSFRLEPTGDPLRPLRRYRLAGTVDGRRLVLVSAVRQTGGARAVRTAVNNLLYSRRGFLVDSVAMTPGSGGEVRIGAPGGGPVGQVLARALDDGMLYHADPEAVQVAVYDHRDGLRRIIRAETTGLPEVESGHGHRIVVSERGRVWIQKHTRDPDAGPADWLVFEADGRWLGVVESPKAREIRRFEIHQVGPWGVLAVWRDREDVEHVGVWPITT